MAFSLAGLRGAFPQEKQDVFNEVVTVCECWGLVEVIDVALMDDEDIKSITANKHNLILQLEAMREIARTYKDGWSALQLIPPAPTPLATSVPSPSAAPGVKPCASSSRSSLGMALSSFTRRSVLDAKQRPSQSSAECANKSLKIIREVSMDSGVEKVHKVFVLYASTSPRFVDIASGPKDMVSMQLQVSRHGSRSAKVVAQRARAAELFFLDISSFGWCVSTLSPFEVATWVRNCVSSGRKTAGACAASTLKLINFGTEWVTHVSHPLVIGQIQSFKTSSQAQEPPVPALTPTLELVLKMEALIDSADTPQLRCMTGFFTLLAYGTIRASDAQGSRGLRLTADAIAAESLMKNKHVWTKWFCSRIGVHGDWASKWMDTLSGEGLPGPDYILFAPNASFDSWLDRPAEYSDIRRALHFIYHLYCGMSLDEAVAYNPHGFRPFMVEAGQQFRSLKVCSFEDVERLGHWVRGSAMPDAYDSASGVSELQVRHVILKARRGGWRPAREGELPN